MYLIFLIIQIFAILISSFRIKYKIQKIDDLKTVSNITFDHCNSHHELLIILKENHSLCAAENKVVIKRYLDNETKNPLLRLENLVKSENHVEAQVGFCARWLLDNICKIFFGFLLL